MENKKKLFPQAFKGNGRRANLIKLKNYQGLPVPCKTQGLAH
jgi:hypothetical protein